MCAILLCQCALHAHATDPSAEAAAADEEGTAAGAACLPSHLGIILVCPRDRSDSRGGGGGRGRAAFPSCTYFFSVYVAGRLAQVEAIDTAARRQRVVHAGPQALIHTVNLAEHLPCERCACLFSASAP